LPSEFMIMVPEGWAVANFTVCIPNVIEIKNTAEMVKAAVTIFLFIGVRLV
jgi:hypothetical protein